MISRVHWSLSLRQRAWYCPAGSLEPLAGVHGTSGDTSKLTATSVEPSGIMNLCTSLGHTSGTTDKQIKKTHLGQSN